MPGELNIFFISGALKYQASDRIKEIAKPARPHNYEIPRLEFWLVKQAAIKGKTPSVSPHLIIKAKRESMELAQFDPNAFTGIVHSG